MVKWMQSKKRPPHSPMSMLYCFIRNIKFIINNYWVNSVHTKIMNPL